MAQDEQIADQQATSENTESGISEQTPVTSESGQSVEAEESNLIPEKFVGKSSTEILQAYRELQKEHGRLSNELGSTRKEREELEEKFRTVERQALQHDPMPTQTLPQQQVPASIEQDPLSAFDSRFDEDPKAAIREALSQQQQANTQRIQEQSIQQRQVDAQDYYATQRRENSDYDRRVPLMQRVVQEYQGIIKPEFLNSVIALKAIDLMSKGLDIDYYSKAAVVKSQADGQSVKEEKRKAQSESSTSEGDTDREFEKMSTDEMEKFLGRSDD